MDSLTCFKAYDIRGKLSVELNEDIAYRIGRAYAEFVKPKSVVLGGDVRLTSESLKNAISEGIRNGGSDVIDIGMVGTEEVYFATSFLNADGGIEVTASHNPIDYNGMKLVRENSKPLSSETGLLEIKALAEKNNLTSVRKSKRGSYETLDLKDDYVRYLSRYIDFSCVKPMKLVMNAGNGSAGPVVDAFDRYFKEAKVPLKLIKIHNEPNGSFPNGIPNPILEENRESTIEAVLEHGADIGIAWDGDFDRCFIVDETGRFLEGYYIVGLLAKAFLQKEPCSKIIHDPRLMWNTIEIAKSFGGEAIQSKTGHAFIKEKMRLEDAIYGGEMSAHHYFRDFFYCDSGMIPWLLIVELVSKSQSSLSFLVNDMMIKYPSPGEINFKVIEPTICIERVFQHFEPSAISIDRTDGISMEFKEWRFNLRKSNTEPLVRLNLETRADEKLLKECLIEITSLIEDL
tara:strand:+ start:2590 stop:3963 length:1374 start_codon:yes stop_codon:yes gene_type:complete